jgi:hypothetical protein
VQQAQWALERFTLKEWSYNMIYYVYVMSNESMLTIMCDSIDDMFRCIESLPQDTKFIEGYIGLETPESIKE